MSKRRRPPILRDFQDRPSMPGGPEWFWRGPSPVVNDDRHTLGIIIDRHVNVLWRADAPVTVAEWEALVLAASRTPDAAERGLIPAVMAMLPARIPGRSLLPAEA